MVYSALSDNSSTVNQFTRRKAITVTTNGTSTPTNYQTKLTITYESEMKADFSDIRFNTKGGAYIDYWIESYTASTTATIWVELLDAITDPGSDSIWMYYGGYDEYVRYSGNPIFSSSGVNPSWDYYFVNSPFLAVDETGAPYKDESGRYYMYYSGSGNADGYVLNEDQTGLARSTDLINWTRITSTVAPLGVAHAGLVLPLGANGQFDDSDTQIGTIIVKDGTFHMWYTGNDNSSADNLKFGYATSNDGITWAKSGDNPIMSYGSGGSDDDDGIYSPHVILDGDTWKMWYLGKSVAEGHNGIMYATAPVATPTVWTKYSTSFVYEHNNVNSGMFGSYVYKEDGVYTMLYTNYDATPYEIWYATSNDGINWTKQSKIISSGEDSEWDDTYMFWANQIYANGQWYTFYRGNDSVPNYGQIGFLTSKDRIVNTFTSESSISDTMVFGDDFEDYALGDLNGNGGWSGSTNFDVQSSVVKNGSKAVSNLAGTVTNIAQIVSYTTGIISVYIREDAANGGPLIRMRNDGGQEFMIYFSNTAFLYRNAAGGVVALPTPTSYSYGEWYKVEFAFDTVNNKYPWIKIDGVTKGTDVDSQTVGTITVVRMDHGDSGSDDTYYDEIYIRKYIINEPTPSYGIAQSSFFGIRYIKGTTNKDFIDYLIDFTFEKELEKILDKLEIVISRRISDESWFEGFDPDVEILLQYDGTHIFRGRVKDRDLKQGYNVEIHSCGEIASRKVANIVYNNQSPESIFSDLINNYTDLTPQTPTSSGTIIDRFVATEYVDSLIKKLADILDWQIWSDADKNIYLEPRGNTTNSNTIYRTSSSSGFTTCGFTAAVIGTTERFDDVANTHTARTAATSRVGTAGYSLNGYGFTSCGYTTVNLGTTERFDDIANSHTTRTAATARRYLAGYSLNGYGFTSGGYIAAVTGTTQRFDDTANTHTARTAATARYGLTGYSLNGYGFTSCGYIADITGTTQRFDDTANTHTARTAATARYHLAGYSLNGYGFTSCGFIADITGTTERFDDTANTHTARTAATARRYLAGYSLNGYGFTSCGYTTVNLGTTERFDDIANSHTTRTAATARRYLAGYSLNRYHNAIFGKWKEFHNELTNRVIIVGDKVQYNTSELFSGDDSTISFTLTEVPINIVVYISDVEQDIASYVITATDRIVTFNTAPTTGSENIKIEYTYAYPIYCDKKDQTSIDTYGEFVKKMWLPWIKSRKDAINYASEYVGAYKDPLTKNTLALPIKDLVTYNVGEEVNIDDDLESIDDDYVIHKITAKYTEGYMKMHVGNDIPTFSISQSMIMDRIKELEKLTDIVIAQLSESSQESITITETFDDSDVNYLNHKVQGTYPPRCNYGRGTSYDARVGLCQVKG